MDVIVNITLLFDHICGKLCGTCLYLIMLCFAILYYRHRAHSTKIFKGHCVLLYLYYVYTFRQVSVTVAFTKFYKHLPDIQVCGKTSPVMLISQT